MSILEPLKPYTVTGYGYLTFIKRFMNGKGEENHTTNPNETTDRYRTVGCLAFDGTDLLLFGGPPG